MLTKEVYRVAWLRSTVHGGDLIFSFPDKGVAEEFRDVMQAGKAPMTGVFRHWISKHRAALSIDR